MEKIISRINELKGAQSVYSFAKFLGLKQASVDRYLKEQRKPSVELIYTICHKFHVSADWILGLSDEKESSNAPPGGPGDQEEIRKLREENARLNGELEGMRYALRAFSSKQ